MSSHDTAAVRDTPWTQPLRLRVHHLTRYDYHDEARENNNEARLHPLTDTTQTCEAFHLRVDPQVNFLSFPDEYGNMVAYLHLVQSHHHLEVEATSIVQTHTDDRGPIPLSNSPESLPKDATQHDYSPYQQASPYVSLSEEVLQESQHAVPGTITNLWQDAVKIGRYVYGHYSYTPQLTSVHTRTEEVIHLRKGVCQDFAHLMLGMCRSRGIPARYVSGYFYNPNRAPDANEASHAWVEIYLPNYGWQGYDPTHDRPSDTRYIKLAIGRDYGDVSPLSGNFRGRLGTKNMEVKVRISLEDLAPTPVA